MEAFRAKARRTRRSATATTIATEPTLLLLSAPAPLRETPPSTASSPIPPPRRCVTSSRAPSSVTAGTEEWKSGQAHDAMPRSEPVDSQRFWARQRFVKWIDLTPLPLPHARATAEDGGGRLWHPWKPDGNVSPNRAKVYSVQSCLDRFTGFNFYTLLRNHLLTTATSPDDTLRQEGARGLWHRRGWPIFYRAGLRRARFFHTVCTGHRRSWVQGTSKFPAVASPSFVW